MIVIRTKALNESVYILISKSKKVVTATKYAEKPIKANADFSRKDAHKPRPLIVPTIGPYVLSRKTYDPPLEGIAEDNSDFDNAPGRTTEAASRNANQIPAPIISAAKVGVTKIPGSIAEREIITTPIRPMVRFNVIFISSLTESMSPLTTPFKIFPTDFFTINKPPIKIIMP